MKNDLFGIEACMNAVKYEIEVQGQNPFEVYGRYMVRAKQDFLFNKTMIDAIEKYIDEKNINWNDNL